MNRHLFRSFIFILASFFLVLILARIAMTPHSALAQATHPLQTNHAGDDFPNATFTVTNTNASGVGSLFNAVTQANANAGADTINFGVNGTIGLTGTLVVKDTVTIDGSGRSVTISGGNLYRVFEVYTGTIANIQYLTIANGKGSTSNCFDAPWTCGGGVLDNGTLTLTNTTFLNNSADYGAGIYIGYNVANVTNSTFMSNTASNRGGGIYAGVTANVKSSTFISNTAGSYGGGISVGAIFIGGGTANVSNSTFSGNHSYYDGGGLYNGEGTVTIKNSTFSGNSASHSIGGVDNQNTMNLANNIIANSTGGDCTSAFALSTNLDNLVMDGTCSPAITGDPKLGPLANNGGATQTFALIPGSPAINAGDDTTCNAAPVSGKDQRGVARPYGPHCDIGSYEYQSEPGPILVVNHTADTNDGYCEPLGQGLGNQDCTLREAVSAANVMPGTNTISFSIPLTDTGCSGGVCTVTLTSSLPAIGNNMTIDGAGQSVTVSGNNLYRILTVNSSVTLALNALTLANGYCNGCNGGGIFNNGTLNVTNTTLRSNQASSPWSGGALFNNLGLATVSNSTFYSNTASGGSGGAIYNIATLNLYNSTLSNNKASPSQGGGIGNATTLNYANTIIAGSTGGDCFNGATIGTNTRNLVQDNSCAPYLHTNPFLGPLANNGGWTQTMALLPASPAINAGDDATCAASPVNNLDQRGVSRPYGAHCDIGAYELFGGVFLPVILHP